MIARDPRQTWNYVLQEDRRKVCPDCKGTTELEGGAKCGTCADAPENQPGTVATSKDERTIHKLRHLRSADEHALLNEVEASVATSGRVVYHNIGARALAILRAGYAGWTNMKDHDGNVVEYKAERSGAPTEESLMRLTLAQRMEIASAIEHEIEVTETELEKSAPLST